MAVRKGLFLTLEGVDGAGKSSHLGWLMEELERRAIPAVLTREPGGTPLGERCRELLLHEPMHLATETLLMFAARNEHVQTVVRPALSRGLWVVCDRFTDATYAYQGGGRGLPVERIQVLEHWVQDGLQPDQTWLFDLPPQQARARRTDAREPDRFEREQDDFFARVRAAYLQRAQADEARVRLIDASPAQAQVRARLGVMLNDLIGRWETEQ